MRVCTLAATAALSASLVLTSLTTTATAATADEPGSGGGGVGKVTGRATLNGEQEVPGPGDANGTGRFRFKIKHDRLCYSLSVRRIAPPTAAHIHFGPRGEAGPVAVTLKTPPPGGTVRGCIPARNSQNPMNAAEVLTFWELRGIAQDTYFFYVNVHNTPFPAGAIRGQLVRTR